jgi:hypothetical protein
MIYAQTRVQREYRRYSQVQTQSGRTAEQVARRMLDDAGLRNVSIEFIPGSLNDSYDPRTHVLRLSNMGASRSIAAIGVAAHEVGHAIQQAQNYAPLRVRTAIYPIVSVSAWIAIPLLMIGFALELGGLVTAALILYASLLAFQLITLPVEYNASARARELLANGYLDEVEMAGATRVLNAAALTYLAAALMTMLQFVRLLSLGRSRR